MKIAVIGANGKIGDLIVKEALSRGIDVEAIVRDASKINEPKVKVLEKDLFDLSFDDVKDCDAVISAFGAWTPEDLPKHTTSLMHLADILSNSQVRLLVVGGAGSLYVDKDHKASLSDTPDFPDEYKPLALAMADGLYALKKRNDVKWTYISPAAFFNYEGPKTGKYKLGGEELMVNSAGNSEISYADYAIAMIDEVENKKHINERISVIS